MKKTTILSGALVAMMCFIGMPGANAQSGEQEIVEYCTIDQFQGNDALYGRGIGESRNQQQARNKARASAIHELGENVEVGLKGLAMDGSNSDIINDDEEYIARTTTISKRVVDKTLSSLKTVCEKGVTYTNAKGIKVYKYYQVVEINKDVLKQAAYDGLSEAGMLKVGTKMKDLESAFDKAFSNIPQAD